MSSGLLLLKQLQERQRQHHQKHEKLLKNEDETNRSKITINDNNKPSGSVVDCAKKKDKESDLGTTTNHCSSCDVKEQHTTSTSSSLSLHGETITNTVSFDCNHKSDNNTATTIEVCIGPDCSGLGGGAALLEIENLIDAACSSSSVHSKLTSGGCAAAAAAAGSSSPFNVRVITGGCRDLCTMGPNVHIHGNARVDNTHFTKVNQPSACRKVVGAVTKACGSTDTNKMNTGDNADDHSLSSSNRIIQLRNDGIRWRTLREKAARERRLRVRERFLYNNHEKGVVSMLDEDV